MTIERVQKITHLVRQAGLAGLAIVPGPNMLYFTGLSFHLSERPIVAFFMANDQIGLIVPQLEAIKTEKLTYPVKVFPYDDVSGPAGAFEQARQALGLSGARLGVEGRRIRFLELALLGDAQPENADPLIAELRMRKDANEIAAMRAAVAVAETAIAQTLPLVRVGVSEREVAAELSLQLNRAGAHELPFLPIVASGPNGANPHATPTTRQLAAGDLVTIDWGAVVDHYISDITRTYAVAELPSVSLRKAYQAVLAGNSAGRAACRPGTTGEQVDRAARMVIDAAGLGQYFMHRTGHGLGLEGHEEPDMKQGVDLVLAPGMTFTIEPGVYLPGEGGVRIEDDMLIVADGAESLTTLPRDLVVIGG